MPRSRRNCATRSHHPGEGQPAPAHQEVNALANKAAEDLRTLGATVIEISYGYEQATKHRRAALATPPLEISVR
jgi:Asp-tRNA(Asn)/Glu-tRNA(Gln) amidotransferase A subunit family amidase